MHILQFIENSPNSVNMLIFMVLNYKRHESSKQTLYVKKNKYS